MQADKNGIQTPASYEMTSVTDRTVPTGREWITSDISIAPWFT
jgi:hypothetical protein